MKIGSKGIALIQAFEKCRLKAFLPTPEDKWTIGWGHTKGVAEGDTCTNEEADAWFLEDIAWVEACVNRSVTAHLLQDEFDALASLCYNIGCPQFSSSTLVKQINENNFDAAAKSFMLWNKQHGEVIAGLTNRRAKEAQLFETANA